MRGIFRRPIAAVLMGSFGIAAGTVFACFALYMMAPRHLIVGVMFVLFGLGAAGIWPADRDLNDHDTRRWQRFGAWATWLPLAGIGIDIFLPVSEFIATCAIVGGFVYVIGANVWFVRHGVPLEDHHIEAELAKPGHNPLLTIVSAKPNRLEKVERIFVVSLGSLVAALAIIGSALITVAFSLNEPPLATRARWSELPVRYCLDRTIDGYVNDAVFAAAVQRSFDRWGVPAESTGECAATIRVGDGVSSIGWGFRGDGEDWLGRTRAIGSCEYFCSWNERSAIAEADLWIEPMPAERYTNVDCLDDLMLHEVGHFIGLHHLETGVMAPGGVCSGEEFTSGDLAALFDRYGDDVQPEYGAAAARE